MNDAKVDASKPRPVLTAEAMREADDYTINEFGISGFTLMESAGRASAFEIARFVGSLESAQVNVYCGKGNNGGDGFVVARYLHDLGARIHVVATGQPGDLSADAETNYRLLQKIAEQDDDDRLAIVPYENVDSIPSAEVHVDALLGTGLTSDLREPLLSLVKRLNDQRGLKIAIDLPTGLHTDLGRPLGAAFRADLTLTLGALKTGHCMNEGKAISGRVNAINIGIPRFALESSVRNGKTGCAWMASDQVVGSWLPQRSHDANKYSVGLALVVAGSAGMTGAPVMASSAAARIGAGYVVCGCDQRIQSTLGVKMTEVTTIPLPASEKGIEADGALDAMSDRLDKAGAALIGCGLGHAPDTQTFIRRFLTEVDIPVVIDADGLNALADHPDLIRDRSNGRWVLTPHMGEFRRLAGDDLDNIDVDIDDRIGLAQHFASKWKCVLLLKGLPSVVAAPDGTAWINETGGPSLASAGTGDVLAGICTGLLAQGMMPVRAAVAALHIGGAAAERFETRGHGPSLQAMDLVDLLPSVLKERFGDTRRV